MEHTFKPSSVYLNFPGVYRFDQATKYRLSAADMQSILNLNVSALSDISRALPSFSGFNHKVVERYNELRSLCGGDMLIGDLMNKLIKPSECKNAFKIPYYAGSTPAPSLPWVFSVTRKEDLDKDYKYVEGDGGYLMNEDKGIEDRGIFKMRGIGKTVREMLSNLE